jgi:uncharacterized repeat protein (TIGR01451 family)
MRTSKWLIRILTAVLFVVLFLVLTAASCEKKIVTEQDCKADLQKQVDQLSTKYLLQVNVSLKKTADPATFKKAGDVITYTYTVTNNSLANISFDDVRVTDDRVNLNCRHSDLAQKQSATCTAGYTITQADVDAGQVTNTASAEGTIRIQVFCTATDSSGNQKTMSRMFNYISIPDTDSATVRKTGSPALHLSTRSSPTTFSGSMTVNFSYYLDNNGDVPLKGPFTVKDELVRVITCPAPLALQPGEQLKCSGSYLIGLGVKKSVCNMAKASAFYDGARVYSGSSSTCIIYIAPPENAIPSG